MATFSIGQALGDAFGLMRRRPLTVLVWGGLFVIPTVGFFALLLPEFAGLVASAARTGLAPGDALPPEAMGRIARLQTWSLGANLAQGVVLAVVYTAIMRAILRPLERAGFSLRLGMDEMRVGVIGIAILVGTYIFVVVATVLAVLIALIIWFGPREVFAVVVFLLVLALLGGAMFVMARLSLIAPVSVLRRDFAFDEGWDLGKGQALRLFGLIASVFGVVALVELVLLVIGMIAVGGLIDFTGPEPFDFPDDLLASIQAWVTGHWPLVGVGLVLACAFYGFVAVVSVAPFASACRQMTLGREEPA